MKRFILIITLLLTLQIVFSDSKSDTVFTYNILDDLYLSLDGSWKFQVDSLYNGQISDLIYNTTFSQIPDFSAALWLFNMFFFETIIKEDSSDNTFLLGYQNSDTLIKEVRIGNDDLNIGSYADYTPTYNKDQAPGLRTKISSDSTLHEILVRYTSEITDSVHFRGYNSLIIDEIYISDYDRDHFFQLPSSYDLNTVLYTTNENGVVTVAENDYRINNSSMVQLLTDSYSSILIDSTNLTTEELEEYSPYLLTDGEKTYLYIYQRGQYSPFICQNVYRTSLSGDDILISIDGEREVHFTQNDTYIIFHEKSPFLDIIPELYDEENFYKDYFTVLQVEITESVNMISVPDNAKENSLTVYINNRREYDFEHNTETGEVTFNRIISPLDEVDINFDIESDPGTSNLLTTYGSRYFINDYLTFDMSHTLDWNISDDDYTYTEFENSGSVHSKGLLNLQYNNLTAEVTSSINSFIPDTKGEFLLTDYKTTTTVLPITLLEIENNLSGYVPLVKRDYSDELLDLEEFYELNTVEDSGAYIITLNHYESSNKVIVIETGELESGESSAVKLTLGTYADNYAWTQQFSLSTLSEVDRELTVHFINSITGNTLSKILSINSADNFSSNNITFSDSDLSFLGYVDQIIIETDSISSQNLFIKDLTFEGVEDIKKSPSGERVQSVNNLLQIPGNSDDFIKIELPVNSVGLESYEKLEFSLQNDDFFTENSDFYIDLYSGSELIKRVDISDIESDDFSLTLPTSGYLNRVILTFTHTGEGVLKLSPLILSTPVTSVNSLHTASISYQPDFSWIIGGLSILDSIKVKIDDELNISTTTQNSLDTEISLNLLGIGLSTELNYFDEELGFGYGVTLPIISSPITLNEYYYYRDYRYRSDSIELSLPFFSTSFSASDQIKENSRSTHNTLKFSLIIPILTLSSETTVQQSSDGVLKDLSTDIISSYSELLISNSVFVDSKTSQTITLSLDTTYVDMKTTIDMDLDTTEETNSSYGLNGELPINIGLFSIKPGYNILYTLKNLENQNNITDQVYEWYYDLTENHPINIKITDLFWGNQYKSFFENSLDNRSISSALSLELNYTVEASPILEIFIPSTISLSTEKILSREGSLTTANVNYNIMTNFTLSSMLINRLQISLSEDLESGELLPDCILETSFGMDIKETNRLIFLHTLNYNKEETKSGTEVNYSWEGKNGPLYIVPILGWILDNPYSFDHQEQLHVTFTDDFSTFKTGFRHETVLSVLHRSEVEIFIDVGYDYSAQNRLYMEAGIYMTLIF